MLLNPENQVKNRKSCVKKINKEKLKKMPKLPDALSEKNPQKKENF
jgi:hypothetical protein